MIRIDINSGNALELALDALSKGAVIVYPTDTIYGFGCDATNHEAINNLNNLLLFGTLLILRPTFLFLPAMFTIRNQW